MTALYPVLTFPRTGSSLAMQTLRELGVSPWGARFRGNLPQKANPGGFYEDEDLIFGSLTDKKLRELRRTGNCALSYKISTSVLVESSEADWFRVFDTACRVFIPLRKPTESACSRVEVFVESGESSFGNEELKRFLVSNAALIEYRKVHCQLLARLKALPARFRELLQPLNFELATLSPAAYVERLSGNLGFAPTGHQVASAIGNIDVDLYRYRSSNFASSVHDWSVRTGATEAYDRLVAYFDDQPDSVARDEAARG